MYLFNNILKFIIIFCSISISSASQKIKSEKCDTPYFVSLKVKAAVARIGPGKQYKIAWKYVVKFFPLLVIAKYDTWRQVKDLSNSISWVKQSQLSVKRYLVVKKNNSILFEKPNTNSKNIVKLGNNVILKPIKIIDEDWCYVQVFKSDKPTNIKGYIQRENIYGLLNNEITI